MPSIKIASKGNSISARHASLAVGQTQAVHGTYVEPPLSVPEPTSGNEDDVAELVHTGITLDPVDEIDEGEGTDLVPRLAGMRKFASMIQPYEGIYLLMLSVEKAMCHSGDREEYTLHGRSPAALGE